MMFSIVQVWEFHLRRHVVMMAGKDRKMGDPVPAAFDQP
jgi:hypothetical protein